MYSLVISDIVYIDCMAFLRNTNIRKFKKPPFKTKYNNNELTSIFIDFIQQEKEQGTSIAIEYRIPIKGGPGAEISLGPPVSTFCKSENLSTPVIFNIFLWVNIIFSLIKAHLTVKLLK